MDTETNETNETATTTTTETEAKHRKRWRFENGTAIVRDVDGKDTTYAISTLPQEIIVRLAFDGMVVRLSRTDDAEAAYAKVLAGEFPSAKAPAVKEVNPWRLAIAAARFDAKKKSAEPVTMDEAKAWASDLDAKVVRAYKTDLTVVKHFNRLAAAANADGASKPSLAD